MKVVYISKEDVSVYESQVLELLSFLKGEVDEVILLQGYMSEKEKQISKTLEAVIPTLPEEKKEYLLGFAEGVAAIAGRKNLTEAEKQPGISRADFLRPCFAWPSESLRRLSVTAGLPCSNQKEFLPSPQDLFSVLLPSAHLHF